MPLTSGRAERAHGQTVVIFAIFLVVLLGSAALTIDYGSWLKARRDYQNVADAASLAGSVQLTRPVTPAKQIAARQAAWKSIEDQLGISLDEVTLANSDIGFPAAGFTPTGTDWRIWVSTPPLGGPTAYAGNFAGSDRVTFVWLEHENQAYFSRVFGLGDRTISGWATAGTFANRFAVITLRKNGMPTNGNPTDLDVSGGTVLNVIDGDIGGNWGLSVNGAGSAIVMDSNTTDKYGVYLNENVPTGGNGWAPGQVRDAAGNPVAVTFQAEVADPNYPAPCLTYGVGVGNGCLEERAIAGFPPNASTVRALDTCPYPVTNVDRLPAGHYNDISVPNNKCVILDPTFNPVTGKENGIFYITGTMDINNSGLVLGDGVTLVFDRNAHLNMNAGATISLNTGNTTNNPLAAACGGIAGGGPSATCKFAAWTARAGSGGHYSWSLGIAPTYTLPPVDPFERGIATYICKTAGAANCGTGGSASTNIFQLNSASGIDYQGLIYAPYDNVKLAGQPTHHDVGQLVAWTAQFTGGTAINQAFDGPDFGTPVLLEPRLGQ